MKDLPPLWDYRIEKELKTCSSFSSFFFDCWFLIADIYGLEDEGEIKDKICEIWNGSKNGNNHRVDRNKLFSEGCSYYELHRDKIIERNKRWKEKNKDKEREYRRVYIKRKKESNPKFRLDCNVSTSIWQCLKKAKSTKGGRGWKDLLGYSLEDLVRHIEKQFDESMSWNNYGSYWHVDHIKPKSLFNYTCPEDEEFKKCWALNNLQPLEKYENFKKNNLYAN